MKKIERLEAVDATEEGTVFHYRAAGRKACICVPPSVVPVLFSAIIETPHRGIGDEIAAAVPASVKFGIATDRDTGLPVLSVLFENKLGIVIETDETLIAALEAVLGALKKRKRH